MNETRPRAKALLVFAWLFVWQTHGVWGQVTAAGPAARWRSETTDWNQATNLAIGDWGFNRPGYPEGLYIHGITRPAGGKVTNPVIYDNDVYDDVFDDELAYVMASEGEMNLAGLIVTPVLTDFWGFFKPDWIKTAHGSRRNAERSGLRMDRIPPITVGTEAPNEKAGENKDSAGARLYVQIINEHFARDAAHPMIVNIGGQGVTLASAYGLDPSIAHKCIVYYTDLRVYNGHYQWASMLIAANFRVVSWGDDNWWITKPAQNQWRVLPRPEHAEGKDNDANSGDWRQLTELRVPLLDHIVKQFQTRGEYCQGPKKGDGYLDGTFLHAWLPGIFGGAALKEIRGGQVLHVTRFTEENEVRVKAFANARLPNSRAYRVNHADSGTAPGTNTLPSLRVSDNHRFLATANGKPFFWLGDTAWEFFHRLNREETERYLADRATKGFNVIQAVALAELDGLTVPNPQGHLPLVAGQFLRPAVVEGLDNDYWDDIEWTLRLAERKGLYVGLLPMWGKYCPADTGNAERYGRFIGERFKDHANLIWILGGDRPAPTKPEQEAWRAMAKGIALGVSGREDYDRVLMTYHTFGPDSASKYFHEDAWLDFTAIQSSHGDGVLNWKMIEQDYQRLPHKPVIDLETTYPELVILKGMKPGDDDHARRSAYWAVFSGAFGHTYGHNSIWQMYAPGRKPILNAKSDWTQALQAPSAAHMGYLRGLIESRPFLTQSPDQSLLADGGGEGLERVAALRGDGYALIYTPTGKPFRVRLDKLTGKQVKAWWFDPRTGQPRTIGQFPRAGECEFTPPGAPGVGNDWVLALDDPQRGLGAPRAALEPYDWRGFGGFDTYKWRGFLLANNRWGGGNGRIWFKEGGGNWSFWTEHSDDLDQGQVKSFPHAGIGWMWGNWAPNQALPISLGELAVAKSDWIVTLPETQPNQSYVAYYQLYTSAVPDPKSDGAKISGDLAIIIHREDFPFEAWGKNLGEFDIGGRKWRVVQKASAIGKSTYIILIPVTAVAKREGNRLVIENFDLKPCIDFCVAKGFYQPADYLLTIQAGWESRVLHGVLRSDDLKFSVGKKGAEPVRLPLAKSIAGGQAP